MAFYMEKQKATSTPYVLADEEKNYMRMEGRCFHEKVSEFFKEVNDWLAVYLESDFGKFTFDCEIEYLNSSSTKLLRNMLLKMNKSSSDKNKITVNWITIADNDIMIECGEVIKKNADKIDFNLVIKN